MKMIKNITKLLTFWIVAVGVATATRVSAFSISVLNDWYLHNQDDWIATSPQLQYLRTNNNDRNKYCRSVSPFSAYSSWSSMSCRASRVNLGFYSYEKWHVMRRNNYSQDVCNNANSSDCYLFSFSNVKVSRPQGWYFQIQYYNNISRSWSTINTDDQYKLTKTNPETWVSTAYDQVVFRDDTVIFYNSNTLESYQFKAWIEYVDWIVLANPYDDDWVDNLWFIKLKSWKAWSTTVSVATAWDIMLWNTILRLDDLYTLFWDSSTAKYYTISRWGVNPFPFQVKNLYDQTDKKINSIYAQQDMFQYSYENNFLSPDSTQNLPDSNVSQDNNYFNANLINEYNNCVNKWENLRKALHLAVMCKNQDENTERENIIYNTWLDYTGSASYCQQLDNFVVNLYSLYSWNRATWVLDYDINLQYISAPINNLIFAWYYHSVMVDANWNISWLPNWNSRCASYTVSNFQNQNKSTIEKISDEITSFFWTGIAKYYQDTINNNQTFSWLLASIKNWTSWYFTQYLFDPYIAMFNSWYNDFHSKIWVWSCSDIHNSVWWLVLWDYALYIVAVVIIFIFIMLL